MSNLVICLYYRCFLRLLPFCLFHFTLIDHTWTFYNAGSAYGVDFVWFDKIFSVVSTFYRNVCSDLDSIAHSIAKIRLVNNTHTHRERECAMVRWIRGNAANGQVSHKNTTLMFHWNTLILQGTQHLHRPILQISIFRCHFYTSVRLNLTLQDSERWQMRQIGRVIERATEL